MPGTRFNREDSAENREAAARADALEVWQENILPFAKWSIAGLAVTVFALLLAMAWAIHDSIHSGSDEVALFAQAHIAAVGNEDEAAVKDVKASIVTLASYRTARRYDFASAAMMTRDSLRLAGFLVGAALCFIGALFVVGKFADASPSTASGSGGGFQASLTTASPGLVAMAFGLVLCVTAILSHYEVEIEDPPIEFEDIAAPQPAPESVEARDDLDNEVDVVFTRPR